MNHLDSLLPDWIQRDPAGQLIWDRRIPSPASDYDATIAALAALVAEARAAAGGRALSVGIGGPGSLTAQGLLKNSNSVRLNGRATAGECGREVVLPSQNIKKTLTEDQPTEIALHLPQEKGEVTFTCGMNMLRGAIVVE